MGAFKEREINMSRFIKDIKKFKKYVTYSAKSGLKAEVAGSHLGWLWWILEPLMFMFVYWFIFTKFFSTKAEFYPVFIFIGFTLWNFFSKTVTGSVSIVSANSSVVSKVYIPKYMLVLIAMLKQAFKMFVSFGIIVIMMIIYKIPVTLKALWLVPIMLTLFLITFGVNCIMAHLGVFVEDLKNAINILLRVVMYMSGVFYEIIPRNGKSKLSEPFISILSKGNPVAFLMTSTRGCLIYGDPIGYKVLAVWFVFGLILSAVGIKLIYKYENSYVKVI